MQANPFLGVLLHSIGGLAAASFYIPYKRVRGWAWENYWLAGGVFSWIIAPWVLSLAIVRETPAILAETPFSTLALIWFFGVLWGVGGLTFGLTMRYLGIALGYAIALGLCAAFGALVPPIVAGDLGGIVGSQSGQITLLGIAISLAGIALSGQAGMSKERELTDEEKQASVAEFSFVKGLLVAVFSGIMSACMNYGFTAGESVAAVAVSQGAPELWKNLPIWIVVMLGGFTTNSIWCLYLMIRNRTLSGYVRPTDADGAPVPLAANYAWCALGGLTWYLQFFFFGMGSTQMGEYGFVSWSLHMASIIVFSTLWGIALKEWRGTSRATHGWIAAGLAVLIGSMIVIGHGNNLKATEDAGAQQPAAGQTGGGADGN